ncbi:DNA-binding response regulator, LytR/AlgR family [Spirosomataceae bacterium TFI 002]|nr:DNA-binding response regulator, LytR/AlgR family [Spirosomataceae bacterium TFI 002]
MLKAIAIDDEPLALEVVKAHAQKVSFLSLQETFVSAKEALEYLKENPVNLLFLDINMPDISGLDFSQLLPESTGVIFTTAYSEYAVDAFSLNAIDYLVKPFNFERFIKACQKAQNQLTDNKETSPYLFIKDSYDLVRITLENLLFVQSEGNYLTFFEKDKKTVTRMTMTEALNTLPSDSFFRVHKSNIVNLHHVQKIERHQLQVDDDTFVPIAGNYHSGLMEELKKLWTVK